MKKFKIGIGVFVSLILVLAIGFTPLSALADYTPNPALSIDDVSVLRVSEEIALSYYADPRTTVLAQVIESKDPTPELDISEFGDFVPSKPEVGEWGTLGLSMVAKTSRKAALLPIPTLPAGEGLRLKTNLDVCLVLWQRAANGNPASASEIVRISADRLMQMSITEESNANTVIPGGELQFNSVVLPDGMEATPDNIALYSQDVTWSVNSDVSTIDADGVLTVSEEETASVLTITASSDIYSAATASYAVSVGSTVLPAYEDMAVTIIKESIADSAELGEELEFSAVVLPTGMEATPDNIANYTQDVTWSVNSELSTIDENGVLSVSAEESANFLVITASSDAYPGATAYYIVEVGGSGNYGAMTATILFMLASVSFNIYLIAKLRKNGVFVFRKARKMKKK
jgi:hypothetical protein